MTVQQVKTNWQKMPPLVVMLISFGLGCIANSVTNYITYANKVELLTQKVAEMNVTVSDIANHRMADQDKTINAIGNRTTALETIVFKTTTLAR